MKKILPLNTNVEIYSECWTHMRLAFILSRSEYYPWYCENLNNYYIENKFYSIEFDHAFTSSYFEIYKSILNDKTLEINAETKDEIVNTINNNGYLILFCNYEYLFPLEEDKTNHEILIFGYDNEEKTFLTYLHYKNKWIIKSVNQKKVIESVYKAIYSQEDYFLRSIRFQLPCIAYFFKENIQENLNVKTIFLQLSKYLEGSCFKNLSCQSHQWIPENKQLDSYDVYFGISVYDAYTKELLEDIKENAENIRDYLFRGIEHLLASKREMENKVKFICNRYNCNYNFVLNNRKVIDNLIIFRNFLMKYYFNSNLDDVKRAISILDETKKMDQIYYANTLEILQNIIEKEVYFGEDF